MLNIFLQFQKMLIFKDTFPHCTCT